MEGRNTRSSNRKKASAGVRVNPIILFALSLCWDVHPDPTVNGFRVFVNGIYRDTVTMNAATVAGLESCRVHSFHVTATAPDGLESDPSNELRYVLPCMSISASERKVFFQVPRIANQSNVRYRLESTTDFQSWQNENYIQVDEQGSASFAHDPMRFYRVRLEFINQPCDVREIGT